MEKAYYNAGDALVLVDLQTDFCPGRCRSAKRRRNGPSISVWPTATNLAITDAAAKSDRSCLPPEKRGR